MPGDIVKISKKHKDFRKGYLPNYTTEILIISQILHTEPIAYRIKDLNGEEIAETFYEEEFSKHDSGIYEIEKVLYETKNKLLESGEETKNLQG